MRTRAFVGALICAALYQGAAAASKELVTGADRRRLYAESMNTDANGNPLTERGEAYFATGTANQSFVVALEPPDQTQCDAWLSFVAQDQTFLQALDAEGFRSVGCVREENGKYITATRVITRKPAPPSTDPHTVPQRHAAKIVEASA